MTSGDDPKALSFGKAVDAYDAARPSYPAEAVDWLLARRPRQVVDLGAGTGKFTAGLVDHGLTVTAVEPDATMLGRLAERLPTVRTVVGSAERIPLPDASMDAVFVAQAWHWVDPDAALAEAARVLRPGGELGLIWNIRDTSVPWVAALAEVIHDSVAEATYDTVQKTAVPFGPVEHAEFAWSNPLDRDGIRALVTSRSGYITATPEQQAAVLTAVDQVLDTHPDLRGLSEYRLPYRTHVYRVRLPQQRRYEHALRGIKPSVWRGPAAILAFFAMFFGIGTITAGIALGIDVATGAVTAEQLASGIVPLTPIGLLGTNLGALLSIPVALGLQWALFGVRPRWSWSVVGRLRWRLVGRFAAVLLPIWIVYAVVLALLEPGAAPRFDPGVLLFLVVVLVTTPLQAAAEEVGLRGLVQRSAGSWFANPRAAFIGSAVIASVPFGLAHFAGDPWLIAYYTLFGVSMSIAAHFSGGLEAPIVIHAVNNTVLFVSAGLFDQLGGGIDRSAGAGGPIVLLPIVVVLAASVLTALLARRWKVQVTGPTPPSHYDAPVR